MFHRLLAKTPGLPKLITLAPELPGAMEFIKEASKDIVISLGHRDTGIVGAAYDDKKVHVEMICDGIPLASAVKAATINPARELGIEKAHGQITEGALSNLLILDQDLNIKDIIFKGQVLSL